MDHLQPYFQYEVRGAAVLEMSETGCYSKWRFTAWYVYGWNQYTFGLLEHDFWLSSSDQAEHWMLWLLVQKARHFPSVCYEYPPKLVALLRVSIDQMCDNECQNLS